MSDEGANRAAPNETAPNEADKEAAAATSGSTPEGQTPEGQAAEGQTTEGQTAESPAGASPETGLAPPIREHLGRKLRATYNEIADKPAYLGDPAIPIELEYQISRLERREVIHNQGVKAVEAALSDIFAAPPPPKSDS